jgi:hypothetical protein
MGLPNGIFRSIPLGREAKLQIRAEATNVFNMVSLGTPNLQTPQTVPHQASSERGISNRAYRHSK